MKQRQKSKRLVFLSGTRADYGKIKPLAKAAEEIGCEVIIFVTGMHMFARYGLTKIEVRNDFKNVTEFINQRSGDTLDVILSKTVIGFSDYVKEANPDLVIIHGDRIEALACSIVCATNYIPCAHIEGGEVSGTIDEVFRHCNTKLSNIHLVSSDVAKRRIMALGEEEGQIHVIGSPELEIHKNESGVTLAEVFKRYEINFEEYGICIFHPVTSEHNQIASQVSAFFDTLVESSKNFVVILPNNDPGSKEIFDAIDQLPNDRFKILPSMRFNYFSELLKNASVLVGNSSTGVREAPYLGIPSLNVGTRQNNRASALSVTQCSAHDREEILKFLNSEWGKRFDHDTTYGDGNTVGAFTKLIKSQLLFNPYHQKTFVDIF